MNLLLIYILGFLIFVPYLPVANGMASYRGYNMEYFVLVLLVALNYEEIYRENFLCDRKRRETNLISLLLLGGMGGFLLLQSGEVSFLDLKYLIFTYFMVVIFRGIKIERGALDIYAGIFTGVTGSIALLYILIRDTGLAGVLTMNMADKNSLGAILAGNILYLLFIHRGQYAKYIGVIIYFILLELGNRSTALGIFVAGIYWLIETYVREEKKRKDIYFYGILGGMVFLVAWWNLDFQSMNELSTGRMSIVKFDGEQFLASPLMGNGFQWERAKIGAETMHFAWLRPLFYGGVIYGTLFYLFIFLNLREFLRAELGKAGMALLIFAGVTGTLEIFSPFGTGSSFLFFWIYLTSLLREMKAGENQA